MAGTVVAACTILTGSTGLRGLVEDPPPVRSITADGCMTVTTLLSVVCEIIGFVNSGAGTSGVCFEIPVCI